MNGHVLIYEVYRKLKICSYRSTLFSLSVGGNKLANAAQDGRTRFAKPNYQAARTSRIGHHTGSIRTLLKVLTIHTYILVNCMYILRIHRRGHYVYSTCVIPAYIKSTYCATCTPTDVLLLLYRGDSDLNVTPDLRTYLASFG